LTETGTNSLTSPDDVGKLDEKNEVMEIQMHIYIHSHTQRRILFKRHENCRIWKLIE
jgi:hypothetical protein